MLRRTFSGPKIAAQEHLAKVQDGASSPAIYRAADALSVGDFEALTRGMLPPAPLGYLMSGVDDDATLRLNREGFQHFQLRARRLGDVSKPDLRTEVFGVPWEMPIFFCPVGGQKMFNPEGEVAVARAARAKRATQILWRKQPASGAGGQRLPSGDGYR